MDQNEPATSREGQTSAPRNSMANLGILMQNARQALASSPIDHPDRAERAALLGHYLRTCYSHTGDISLINEAIEVEREVLALRPPGHPDQARSVVDLATSLHVCYRRTGDVMLLDEAIGLKRKALTSRPPGHPDRADSCTSLGVSLHECYELTGNVALLDEAIELEREALALEPPGHPSRAHRCTRLGTFLYVRYKSIGDISLLDEAIDLTHEAWTLRPPGHPDRAKICGILAASLLRRYELTGDVSLLDVAIKLKRETLALQSPGHPSRANSCVGLAVSLHMCYEQTGNLMLLDEAIGLVREALVSQPLGHPDRANSCVNLGIALHVRYEQSGDLTLLDEAIKLKREALSLQSSGDPNRANSYVGLAVSLHVCYQRTGNVALLGEAIELKRKALVLRPPGHPDRANSCVSLSASLHVCYEQTGDVALLDEAIELKREALALQSPGHLDRARSCVGLAVSLHVRYEQTANVALLDEAIKLEREALALQPRDHPARANNYSILAASLHARHQQTGDIALLDEAIELKRKALALRPPGHPDHSISCGKLAVSLHVRYVLSGNIALLDEAIEFEREALISQPPGHPERPNSCVSLGTSLHVRYERTGDVSLLDEAIKLKREALALQSLDHPDRAYSCVSLGVSLHVRSRQTNDVVLVNEAIDASSYALQHLPASRVWYSLTQLSELHLLRNIPQYSVLTALEYLQQSFQNEVDNIRSFISSICFNVVHIWGDPSGWSSRAMILLVAIYAQVVDRLPLVANFVLNTSARLQSLIATRRVGSDACIAALLAEQPAAAVSLLDRAHGVLWTQALHQRDPQMEGAPKDLAIELEDLLRATATSTSIDLARLPDHPEDLRHRQNTRIQALLREIRGMPGLSRFMLGSPYETLREAARSHPVVVLVAGHSRAFAVIMPNSANAHPDFLSLDVTWTDLRSLADTAGKANLRYRAGSTEHRPAEAPAQTELTNQERAMGNGNFGSEWSPLASLWRDVVKPVLTHLHLTKEKYMDQRPRLHWCTAGEFAHVPVHAAGIYHGEDQECCSDYVVSSYTPTLSTLLRARKGLQPIKTTDAKILLVAAKHTADARLPPLGKVEVETGVICSVVEKVGVQYAALSQSVAKTEQATAALPAANLVHIACHGLQHASEPLKSAFHLSDHHVLSVSNLMELDLKNAYLAFLSACETAKGDRVQSDQAIHLAATMLFVGFKSVVATMWAMRDEDGPVVSKAFYEKLLEGETITADTIPYALDYAVRKLRESGAPIGSWATFIHVGA